MGPSVLAVRPLAALLFAAAVGCTVLAGDGLVLVPHTHALGTPTEHPHGLALYRFPIALLGAPPDAAPLPSGGDGRPQIRSADPFGQLLVGASLLIAAAVVLLMAAPAIAATGRAASPFLPRTQWSPAAPCGPPRREVMSH